MTADPSIIRIDLDDVRTAGSVDGALHAHCASSSDTLSGEVGPTFATSGPGSGWTKKYGASDFAARAMEEGAVYYLNADNGRVAYAPDWEDDEYAGEEIEWTEESMVRIECPRIEDAIEQPRLVAEMAKAVVEYHGANSDKEKWGDLVWRIKALANALSDHEVDADDFE